MAAGVRAARLLLALIPGASAQLIDSVNKLNAYIESGVGSQSVGFLSTGNYQAIASILPKSVDQGGPLRVKIFESLESITAAVKSGDIVAGLSTSRPENDDGSLTEFPASLITMRAPMFGPGSDSQALREAYDAAVIRTIAEGGYQALESKYFKSDGFDTVAAFTCGVDPSKFPYPPASSAGGALGRALARKELRVGALGPYNWGYQGDYTAANVTGFWPEYFNLVAQKLTKQYPGLKVVRVFDKSSDEVMDGVLSKKTELTELYWTVSAWYKGRARAENMEVGCSTLGTESIFFTKGVFAVGGTVLPLWAFVLVILASMGLVGAICCLVIMIKKERMGTPIFLPLVAPEPKSAAQVTTTSPVEQSRA